MASYVCEQQFKIYQHYLQTLQCMVPCKFNVRYVYSEVNTILVRASVV